jgi:hypothetical protein
MLAAIVIAPLAWLLLAFGQDTSLQAFADRGPDGSLDSGDFLRPLLFLAAAGLLLGLIATLRFSPLGAVLTGVMYAGSYVLLLAEPRNVLRALPKNVSIFGWHADTTTPLRTGTTLLVGALLLVALVSIGRWRRWPDREAVYEDRRATPDRDRWEPDIPAADRTPSGLLGWTSLLRDTPDRAPMRGYRR